jgi:hypothetical protein
LNTFSNRIQITKDENQKNKEQEVYAKIAQIISSVEPKRQEASVHNQITFVSIEDALKELLELEKPKP